jgi:hypothetical protein
VHYAYTMYKEAVGPIKSASSIREEPLFSWYAIQFDNLKPQEDGGAC